MGIGTSSGPPRAEFFVRENKDDALAGPYHWKDANEVARKLSNDLTKMGLAEVVTRVGSVNRGGDPSSIDRLTVVFMYRRGRRLLGGRTAAYHSEKELPPAP